MNVGWSVCAHRVDHSWMWFHFHTPDRPVSVTARAEWAHAEAQWVPGNAVESAARACRHVRVTIQPGLDPMAPSARNGATASCFRTVRGLSVDTLECDGSDPAFAGLVLSHIYGHDLTLFNVPHDPARLAQHVWPLLEHQHSVFITLDASWTADHVAVLGRDWMRDVPWRVSLPLLCGLDSREDWHQRVFLDAVLQAAIGSDTSLDAPWASLAVERTAFNAPVYEATSFRDVVGLFRSGVVQRLMQPVYIRSAPDSEQPMVIMQRFMEGALGRDIAWSAHARAGLPMDGLISLWVGDVEGRLFYEVDEAVGRTTRAAIFRDVPRGTEPCFWVTCVRHAPLAGPLPEAFAGIPEAFEV